MHRALSSRIEQLESQVPTPQPAQLSKEEREQRDYALLKAFRSLSYEPKDREELLTLEERLAIARKDAMPKPEAWEEKWDPQLGRQRSQRVPTDWGPAIAARALEISILERDGAIDARAARRLHEDSWDHFRDEPKGGAELLGLPYPIVIADVEEVAAQALIKCPLFGSLPLEKQLLRLEEDLLREQQRVAAARMAAERANATVQERVDVSMAELGIIGFDQQIAKLKEKIAERDRTSGPSDREASATHQPRQL